MISGDNPRTVGAVARRVGLPKAPRTPSTRASSPRTQDALADVLEEHSVFGRVTPQQKRAMVGALQSRGHVVAMTGDGVNDALALKDADIGIAMGSGAAATRAVAQLVLLDGKFATMPGVVAEGRRVIANIERSANLFVTKTVYAMLIAVVVVITGWQYPFLPRHLTIVSTFTIGIPGVLPRARAEHAAVRARASSTGCCGSASRPGLVAGVGVARSPTGSRASRRTCRCGSPRTSATLVLVAVGLWVLVILARPFNWWKTLLVGVDGRLRRGDPAHRAAARLLRARAARHACSASPADRDRRMLAVVAIDDRCCSGHAGGRSRVGAPEDAAAADA